MKNEHTPTPWSYSDEGGFRGPKNQLLAVIIDSASTTTEEQEANADHIVRCVNSHDELIAALKEMVSQFGEGDGHDSQNMADVNAISLARAAIAKAEAQ